MGGMGWDGWVRMGLVGVGWDATGLGLNAMCWVRTHCLRNKRVRSKQDGLGWDALDQDRMGWVGQDQNAAEGVGWGGSDQDGTQRGGVARDGSGWDALDQMG